MAKDTSGDTDTTQNPIDLGEGGAAPPAETVEEIPAVAAVEEETARREAPPSGREKVVPIAEAIRLRKRAQEAESKAGELAVRVGELEKLLDQAREALDSVERRRRVDLALLEADAVDLESARLLTELALGEMERPDEAVAVGELKRRKPFLFRSRPARMGGMGGGGAMSGRSRQAASDSLLELAEEASRSGDRRALLRYLQARRAAESAG